MRESLLTHHQRSCAPPPPTVTLSYTPTVSFQLQLQLQRFYNRRLQLPCRFPNRRQPVLQAFAATPCGPPFLRAQAWGEGGAVAVKARERERERERDL